MCNSLWKSSFIPDGELECLKHGVNLYESIAYIMIRPVRETGFTVHTSSYAICTGNAFFADKSAMNEAHNLFPAWSLRMNGAIFVLPTRHIVALNLAQRHFTILGAHLPTNKVWSIWRVQWFHASNWNWIRASQWDESRRTADWKPYVQATRT
jgi:hypothetical protein